MDNSIIKITTIEAVCLVVIITINRIILNLPQTILNNCGSSAILNIIYISIIAIIFIICIVKLFKRFNDSDIIDISEFVGGNFLKNLTAIVLISYLLVISSALLRNFAEILHIVYYSRTNIVYLLIFFVSTAFIANFLGEKSVVKSNVVLTLIMGASLLLTFAFVIPNLSWQRIFPILGYGGLETFVYGLSNAVSFNGILCIYFLVPMLSESKDFKKISIISVIIIGIFILLATGCLLLTLSFNQQVQSISPIYTLISNNKFGDFLHHPESLFVFTWILSFLTYLNVVVLFSVRFGKKLTKVKYGKFIVLPICVVLFILALLPQNIIEAQKVEEITYKFVAFPLAFVIFPIILIIANIKAKHQLPKSNIQSKT